MRGYHLYFFRHGLTKANEEGRYIGRTDYALSDYGAAQLVSKKDAFVYPRVEKIYLSPLRRCVETAEILFPGVETMPLWNLAEMDFGSFEGKKAQDLASNAAWREWMRGGAEVRAPGGESLQEVQVRIFKALCAIIGDMMRGGYTSCAAITHAGILANALAGFGLPKIPPEQLMSQPGEGFEVLLTADLWQRSQAFEILGMVPFEKQED